MRTLLLVFLSISLPLSPSESFSATRSRCGIKVESLADFSAWIAQETSPEPLILPRLDKSKKVLVIGAGPFGLAAAAALKSRAIPFMIAEAHSRIGGVWDDSNPQSPAYDSLQTNSSTTTTSLGIPWEGPPRYILRADALTYLRHFCLAKDLSKYISFRTEVVRAAPTPRGTWSVTLFEHHGSNQKMQTTEYRGLVVASGKNLKKNRLIPKALWEQAARAGLNPIHSSDYRNPTGLEGQNVLIVGFGNSGAEIATEVSKVAANTYVAVRSSPWIVPLRIGKTPADAFVQSGPQLPPWLHGLEMWVFHRLQRYYVGSPTRLGFPWPDHDLLEKLPVSDRGIVKAILSGAVQLRPELVGLEDGVARYSAGNESDKITRVIFATGYTRSFSFLAPEIANLEDPDTRLPLHLFHPTEPGLTFMSETPVAQGSWPIAAKQAQAIAAYFAAEESGAPHIARFNALRTALPPEYQGPTFTAADHWHVDVSKYIPLLDNFADWIVAP